MLPWNFTDLSDIQPIPFDNSTMQISGTINGTMPVNMTVTGHISTVTNVMGLDYIVYMMVFLTFVNMFVLLYVVRKITPRPKE